VEARWKEFQPTSQGLDQGKQPYNHLGLSPVEGMEAGRRRRRRRRKR